MRIGVISDIHGNYQALQSILNDSTSQQLDTIISLGDNIGYGPEPELVVQELLAREISSVMGNHELALIRKDYYAKLNFLTQESLDITRTLLSSPSLTWLGSLQPYMVSEGIRYVHGTPPDSITTYLFNPSEIRIMRLFQDFPEWLTFAGHTHTLNLIGKDSNNQVTKEDLTPGARLLADNCRYIVIPGSVGQPRDTVDNSAKYAIFDIGDNSLEIRSVNYDVSETVRKLKKLNFPMQNWMRLQ
ncbi:MAG: metallophosphoesterase [Desulfobulbaceae bacterium]|nr:MAG: metallophosphoesterase [Desulfobulbaceae bacterium]